MSFQFQLSPVEHLGLITASGEIDAQQISDTVRRILDDENFSPGMHMLLDLREVTGVAVTSGQMRNLAELLMDKTKILSTARIATVVSDPFVFGIAGMFAGITSGSLPNQLVTMDYGEGLRFLRLEHPIEAIF